MLNLIKAEYVDTSELINQLNNSTIWDTITYRTNSPASPHRELSDIWVRYNPLENFKGDLKAFNSEHISEWYPVIEQIPAAKSLSEKVFKDFNGHQLGAVLITKIPAGKTCYPHVDLGWHARHYEKYALQVKGNYEQSFHVADKELHTKSGDLFWFDNSITHWVLNPSAEDRITMIICIRKV